jgi:hypothetical protein
MIIIPHHSYVPPQQLIAAAKVSYVYAESLMPRDHYCDIGSSLVLLYILH